MYDLVMRCTLVGAHKVNFASFENRVNDTVKIAFKRSTCQMRRIKSVIIAGQPSGVVSNNLYISTMWLAISMEK